MKRYLLLATLLLLNVQCYSIEETPLPESILQEAQANYTAAEKTNTIVQRKEAFNKALSLYTKIEENPNTASNNNGKLYYDIANNYFQLEEYPMAILYYYRALALRPSDEKVRQNLTFTLNKLGLDGPTKPSAFDQLLFFHTQYSFSERMQLFFIFGLLLLGCASAYLWQPQHWLKHMLLFLGILCALFLLSVSYTRYFSSVNGIMIHTTSLYRDAGEQYAKVSDQPILPGVKVQVLEVLQNGTWLKILSPTNEVGYVPATVIRVI